MIRLKDVAEACNVSIATVSRALNGSGEPGNEKTDMIRRTAREMGYFPNAAARTLKTSRSNNIGILYEDKMDHDYFSVLIDALRDEAASLGYDLTFISRAGDGANYYERARMRNLDGVIVVQADFTSAGIIRLATSSLPTVMIDHELDGCDCVTSDNLRIMEKIVRAAYDKGHRSIAFIHGDDGAVTRNRMAGFYKSCAELGLRVPAEYVIGSRFRDQEGCGAAVLRLLSSPEPPTCVLCPDDYSCIGTLNMLAGKGIRVPEDVSLIGFDGIRMGQMTRPVLTTCRQDAGTTGKSAIRLLTDAIENPETHVPQQIHVNGSFVEGETLGRVRRTYRGT